MLVTFNFFNSSKNEVQLQGYTNILIQVSWLNWWQFMTIQTKKMSAPTAGMICGRPSSCRAFQAPAVNSA